MREKIGRKLKNKNSLYRSFITNLLTQSQVSQTSLRISKTHAKVFYKESKASRDDSEEISKEKELSTQDELLSLQIQTFDLMKWVSLCK